jgi:hypothetical protein
MKPNLHIPPWERMPITPCVIVDGFAAAARSEEMG